MWLPRVAVLWRPHSSGIPKGQLHVDANRGARIDGGDVGDEFIHLDAL